MNNSEYLLYGKTVTSQTIGNFLDGYYRDVLREGSKHRISHILEMIDNKKQSDILDYGSGWGVFSKILSERGSNLNITGIDLDSHSVKISREITGECENLKFHNTSILDLDNQSFDYVVSMQVVEHVHNPGNYLKEINRVLKNDSYLIISLPNIVQPRSLLKLLSKSSRQLNLHLKHRSEYILGNYSKEHDHIQSWDPYHFVTFASSLGFQFEEVRMVEGVPMPYMKYWHSKIFGLKNLSYKMVFKFRKVKFIDIGNNN